ncbi:MAG: hypothetical protein AAGF12_02490 [Myxococcota bacterium]
MRVWVLVVGCAIGFPSPVAAQDDSAREAFERGRAAYAEGQLETAIAHMEESFSLRPHLATAFNLAVIYEAAGRWLPSAEYCARILAGEFGPVAEAQRAEVQGLLTGLEARLGRLELQVEGESEAWARVDGGRRLRLDAAAPRTVYVVPGEHEVSVEGESVDQTLQVRVQAGAVRAVQVDQRLPAPGELIVVASDDAAEVQIVGVGRGVGELRETLAPGTYRVRVVDEPGTERSVDVQSGERTRVQLRVPDEGGVSPWVWVALGVAVVAVAAGAVAIGFALQSPEAEPDPVLGIIEALELAPRRASTR